MGLCAASSPCSGEALLGSSIWLLLWLLTEQSQQLQCPNTHLGIPDPSAEQGWLGWLHGQLPRDELVGCWEKLPGLLLKFRLFSHTVGHSVLLKMWHKALEDALKRLCCVYFTYFVITKHLCYLQAISMLSPKTEPEWCFSTVRS